MKRMPFNSYELSQLSILVVESHPLMRRLMKEVLEALGAGTVLQTQNTEEAWRYFGENQVDLVVTDWGPTTNTINFINALRSRRRSRDPFVPIIVVTAFTDIKHLRIAQDAGMTEFISRPVTATLVYGRICAVIENQRDFVSTKDFFGPDRRSPRALPYKGTDRRFRIFTVNHFPT